MGSFSCTIIYQIYTAGSDGLSERARAVSQLKSLRQTRSTMVAHNEKEAQVPLCCKGVAWGEEWSLNHLECVHDTEVFLSVTAKGA